MKKSKSLLRIIVTVCLCVLVLVSCVFGLQELESADSSEADSRIISTTDGSSESTESRADVSLPEGSSSEVSKDPNNDESSSVISNDPDPDESSSAISDDPGEPAQNTVVSFLACPDNIIHPSVFYDAIERAAEAKGVKPSYSNLHDADYNFEPIYEHVADMIKSADIAYINQETLVGGRSGNISGYPCFNSPRAIADTVVGLGFDVVNVAHNHMLDSRNTSFLDNCNSVFKSLGVEVIGYYPNKESLNNITVIERKGIKVAFLSYTYSTNGIKLPSSSSVVIPYFEKSLVKKQVELAKKVADVTIVSCHWGVENSYNPNSMQKEYAKYMCDLGVDVVLGMHPHVIQPMEWMTSQNGSKTLVVYSLGNFVSGMRDGSNMLAGMLSFNFVKNGKTGAVTVEAPFFIPTVTQYSAGPAKMSNDTGYRDFKIYLFEDYTEELAAKHGVCTYEKNHASTLVGGKFSKQNLLNTILRYIPKEFLPQSITEE